jgi:hypothetical protein
MKMNESAKAIDFLKSRYLVAQKKREGSEITPSTGAKLQTDWNESEKKKE